MQKDLEPIKKVFVIPRYLYELTEFQYSSLLLFLLGIQVWIPATWSKF